MFDVTHYIFFAFLSQKTDKSFKKTKCSYAEKNLNVEWSSCKWLSIWVTTV